MNRIAPGWNPASFLTPQNLKATPVNSQNETADAAQAQKTADDERTAEADAQAAFNSLQL